MSAAYIVDGIRTPIGKFGGSLSSIRADDMAALTIKHIVENNPAVDWDRLDDVVLGCANQAGDDNRNIARMAALLAGLPVTATGNTVNRLCGSGLDAIGTAARAIKSGEQDLIIAGGVESMSRAPLVMPKPSSAFSRNAEIYDTTIGWRFVNEKLAQMYGVEPMPETAENVAEQFNISRKDQDYFAFNSQIKALAAQENGRLAKEIIPVTIPRRKQEDLVFSQDEHLRLSSLEKLGSLRTPFREGGSVTAGNASGINDGACALLIASEKAVKAYGLAPIARIEAMAVAGVEPRIMGIGPAPATQKLLAMTGVKLSEMDVIELNEAFASQGLAVLRELGLDDMDERVNPNGGAIALGHPLGMSGARIALTAIIELREKQLKKALCTMCIGVGQGVSVLFDATG